MSAITSKTVLRKLEALKIICEVFNPEDIISQLIQDGAISKEEVQLSGKRSDEKIEYLLKLIHKLEESSKLMLVEFEWQILPQHKVKMMLVTPAGVREFEA